MTMPLGQRNLNSVLRLVNALHSDAGDLKRIAVSAAPDPVAARRVDDSAAKLHASTTAAMQAVEELGLGPSVSAPLRAVRDGAKLANAGPPEHVAFGRQVEAAVVETRTQISTRYGVSGLLDGTLDDPIRARAALRERLEQLPDGAGVGDLLVIRRLVGAADAGPDAPGLARALPDGPTFDGLVDATLAGSYASPAKVDQYLETWLARLNGDTSTDERRLAAIQRIVTKRPNEVTFREWTRLRVLADADLRSSRPVLTQEFPSIEGPVDAMLARFAESEFIPKPAQIILGTWRTDTGLGFAVPQAMALIDGELPAHTIRREDVAAFLEGSAWPYPVFQGLLPVVWVVCARPAARS